MSDFHKRGDPPAIRHIRFGEGHASDFNQMPKIPERAQVLARCNWQTAVTNQTRVTGKIVWDNRLL
jgi:hypothetical protein